MFPLVQLDFVQPENFNLEYMTAESSVQPKSQAEDKAAAGTTALPVRQKPAEAAVESSAAAPAAGDNKEVKKNYKKPLTPGCARPVMIHRAMAGSIERFTAILCEHFAGKWPYCEFAP